MSQESGNSLDECLQVSPEVAVSSEGSAGEDPPSHSVTSLAGSSSLWVIGLGASVPFSSRRQFPTWQLASLKAGEQERILPIKPCPFCYPVLEVTHHFPCLILLSRSKSLHPAHGQEEGLQKGLKSRRYSYRGSPGGLPVTDTQACMACAKVHILSAPL